MRLYDRLRTYRERIGAPWFTGPHDLNCIILRGEPGTWGCLAALAYLDLDGVEQVSCYAATSYASAAEWPAPTHPDGCLAILDGHYPGAWAPGEHHGRWALRQVAPMRYVRLTGPVPSARDLEVAGQASSFTALRGTHWHDRRDERTPARPILDDTEGCVVTMSTGAHRKVRRLVELQVEHVGSGVVSPTFAAMRLVVPT